jgi:tetratricopeptide (TPR) repeat protein
MNNALRIICIILLETIISAAPLHAETVSSLGKIDFPNSGSEAAQPDFLKGVLLLHSFEYDDARSAFIKAQEKDKNFALAYWGEAMTHNHPIWMERDRAAAMAALAKLAPSPQARLAKAKTEREKGYLHAVEILYADGEKRERDLAYAEAMRKLYEQFPDDLEAASFYALALLGSCQFERNVPTYMKAAAIVEEVFDKNPSHPGAVHYLIHAYDDPAHAPLGLRPARVYAKIAPAAPHALHMPSHIFLALGMWNDVVASNEASWKASAEQSYHALHWLQYAHLQLGRRQEARKLLSIMEEHTKQNAASYQRRHLIAMKAAYVVETNGWNQPETSIAVDTADLEIGPVVADLFIRGASAAKTGKLQEASGVLADMTKRIAKVKPTKKGGGHHSGCYTNPLEHKTAEVIKLELQALISAAKKNKQEALKFAAQAAAQEDALTFEFGPPSIVKPAHELYAELLLESGKYKEASAEFDRALQKAPGRALSIQGRQMAAAKMR